MPVKILDMGAGASFPGGHSSMYLSMMLTENTNTAFGHLPTSSCLSVFWLALICILIWYKTAILRKALSQVL